MVFYTLCIDIYTLILRSIALQGSGLPASESLIADMQINPARNGGVFHLIFKMSGGYIVSDFVWQNHRLWKKIYTFGNRYT